MSMTLPKWLGAAVLSLPAAMGAYMVYAGLHGSQDLMFPSRNLVFKLPSASGLPFQTVQLAATDGTKLLGWYVPASQPTHKAVVLFHGRGSNKSEAFVQYGPWLHDRYNLFLYDSRDSGESGGEYQTLGWYEAKDAAIALQWVRRAGNTSIGVSGVSMGGAVAVEAAAAAPDIRAVWEDCAFDSLHDAIAPRAAALGYPFSDEAAEAIIFTVGWRSHADVAAADPIRCVAALAPRPLYIVHGQLDDETPPINGEKLFDAARGPKQIWRTAQAKHAESASMYPAEYRQRMRAFFAAAL